MPFKAFLWCVYNNYRANKLKIKNKNAKISKRSGIVHKNLPSKNKELLRNEFKEGIININSFPEELILATTIRCSKTPPCAICERNLRTRDMEFDCSNRIIKKLKPVLPYLDVIYLHCSGEPLIYKKFNKFLSLIKPPTRVRLNTNGELLNKEKIKVIVDSNVIDVINFSIDAATEETYKKVRGSGFGVVINNIKNLEQYKKITNKKRPSIIINMCVIKENFKELPKFIELAKEVCAESVDFFHLNRGPDWQLRREGGFIFDYKSQEKINPNLHDEMIIKAYQRCKKLNIGMNFVGSVFLSNKNRKQKEKIGKKIREIEKTTNCIAPWSRVVIGVDGNVRICYFHKEWDDSIGNLYKNTFEEIWNGPRAIAIRKEFLEMGHSKSCEKENICIYRGRV